MHPPTIPPTTVTDTARGSLQPDFEIRPLRTHAELAACVEMQRDTWGREFNDLVPPTILKVSQRIGGVSAGAFAPDGQLLGFVFGMTGIEQGRVVHWSDMLAVRPELRDQGIGRALKAYQREQVRAAGAVTIYWTYDPLQARNAHLNLETFGVRVTEYVEDMYGSTESDLHRGLGTDRFIVAWDVEEDAMRREPTHASDAPLLNAEAPGPSPRLLQILDARPPAVRVQIPLDIGRVQAESLDDAARWRESTRAAFTSALARGYTVAGFARDPAAGRGEYVLRAGSEARP